MYWPVGCLLYWRYLNAPCGCEQGHSSLCVAPKLGARRAPQARHSSPWRRDSCHAGSRLPNSTASQSRPSTVLSAHFTTRRPSRNVPAPAVKASKLPPGADLSRLASSPGPAVSRSSASRLSERRFRYRFLVRGCAGTGRQRLTLHRPGRHGGVELPVFFATGPGLWWSRDPAGLIRCRSVHPLTGGVPLVHWWPLISRASEGPCLDEVGRCSALGQGDQLPCQQLADPRLEGGSVAANMGCDEGIWCLPEGVFLRQRFGVYDV
ncbi:hypothetical protein ABH915_001974 [Arthrobacter sp. MW3 TE3886]